MDDGSLWRSANGKHWLLLLRRYLHISSPSVNASRCCDYWCDSVRVKTYYEYKRPWWTGTWDINSDPSEAEQEVLFCWRGFRALGESGVQMEMLHEERCVIATRVKSITLKYHMVDISETETPIVRHKFSLFVCYCVWFHFQGRTRCYTRREWFDLYPGACFAGTEFDNYPDTEFVDNDTFDDEPELDESCIPNHCVCYNRTFETIPETITFTSENNDEPIELYCGCNVGTPACINVPNSFRFNSILYALANPPVASTVRIQSTGGLIAKRNCDFPFNFGDVFNSTITCPFLDVTRYDPSEFNTVAVPCIRFPVNIPGTFGGVNTNSHCTRTTTPTDRPPFDNNPFWDNLCPPEDAIAFCPDEYPIDRARWYADIYDNWLSVSGSSTTTPPTSVCFDPIWEATVTV